MSFHDKETSPLVTPQYTPSSGNLLPQYTTDITAPTERHSRDYLRTPLQILKRILNLLPYLFIRFCVFYSAFIVHWAVNNPNATTTVPFSSTPISAKELANNVLFAWVMGWVKVYLACLRGLVYQEMWEQEFEYTQFWAGFDTCVGGLVAVVVVPFAMMNRA